MISFFKRYFRRRKAERLNRDQLILSLVSSSNKLCEVIDDLGEYRSDMNEVLVEKLEEIRKAVEKSGGQILEASTPMMEVGQKLSKYLEYELKAFEKMQEIQDQPKTPYDDRY